MDTKNKDKEKFIEDMFNKGILINKDIFEKELDETTIDKIEHEGDLIVLNNDYLEVISQQKSLVDWYEIDKYRVNSEKERNDDLYQAQLQNFKKSNLILNSPSISQEQEIISAESEIKNSKEGNIQENVSFSSSSDYSYFSSSNHYSSNIIDSLENDSTESLSSTSTETINKFTSPNKVEIVLSYQNKPYKYNIKDFTQIFTSRYRFLESLLRNRQELQNTMTINRILSKKEKIALIGLIENISETKNGNTILTMEDPTGKIKVLLSNSKSELYKQGKDLVLDEVIGISGVSSDKFVFAEEIVWPDIPSNNLLKKSYKEEYAIFLSDIHVGSSLFMKEEFDKFLQWINGNTGNEKQRLISEKVKYIIIAGDLVDGIGIYPTQIEELEIKDIVMQYDEFCRLIRKIPSDKEIILCPGNHDAIHLAEPQTSFDDKFAPGLFKIPNVTLVTNPSIINIGKTNNFEGFNILIYHGYSFDYYVNNVESIRNGGGYHRADLVMKCLLKRRHLAPSFQSTPYFPAHKEDPLLIKKIPDFFISGHIHYSKVANYKNVTMISGSCWQEKTSFQEKLGHEPEPARVPIVNLKTREVSILRFK
ncbi:MAG: metallophosphoesterase [Nanoarchaeota archaeon]